MKMYFMEWMDIQDRELNNFGFYVYRDGKAKVTMVSSKGHYLYQEVTPQ